LKTTKNDILEALTTQETIRGERFAWRFRWVMLGLIQSLAWSVWLVQGERVGFYGILLSGSCLVYNGILTGFIRKGRTDTWIRYTSMMLDIGALTAYNALDAYANSPLVPVTTATLMLYPVVLFFAALRLDRKLIVFSTLFTVVAMNALFFYEYPHFDPGIASKLVCANILGQVYRTAYLVLQGVLLMILPSTVKRLLLAQKDAYDKSLHNLRLAQQDSVTGLANHRHLHAFLDESLQTTMTAERGLAVVSIGLDEYRAVHDELGRNSAEFVLIEVARRLERATGVRDVASRLSENVFVVVFQDVGSREETETVIQKILARLAVPLPLSGWRKPILTSIGIALAPKDGNDADDLLQKADDLMVDARKAGGNRYLFSE